MSDEYGYPRPYVDPSVNPGLWLGLSIASTLFCCTPLGIVGIVFAAMAMDARNRGDEALCAQRTQTARAWASWSFFLGIGVLALVVCLGLAQGGGS
ncbi:MAG TPA: CD225/dispanin family protein [Micromonosporaceae bacterium]|nr:CD225/dispanin family protein [Micromonosporaceae bacterium]